VLIELNLKAKRKEPPAPPPGTLHIQEGKYYLMNNGLVVGPMKSTNNPILEHLLCAVLPGMAYPNYWKRTGEYDGKNIAFPKSIKEEVWQYWEEEQHWLAGGKLDYRVVGPDTDSALMTWIGFPCSPAPMYEPDNLRCWPLLFQFRKAVE
jgi:hypothetical protein